MGFKELRIDANSFRLSNDGHKIYAVGMCVYAKEFHDVAQKTEAPIVKAYLIGRAIELYLKAYLIARGYDEKQLKKLSHRISKVLDECQKNDLASHCRISEKIRADIETFSVAYSGKEYEYFPFLRWVFFRQRPPRATESLFSFADALEKTLKTIIERQLQPNDSLEGETHA